MRPAWPGSRRRGGLTLGLVLGAHLAVLMAWQMARTTRTTPMDAPARVGVRLIPLPAVPVSVAPAPSPIARARAAAPGAPPRRSTPPPLAEQPPAPPPHTAIAVTASERAEPAASAPEATPSLLDTEATRRAIRAAARTPSLGERLARSRAEPARLGAGERLAHGVREAGKGDCLKGEYAGAGMGLLSLPFLALAAATDACAK